MTAHALIDAIYSDDLVRVTEAMSNFKPSATYQGMLPFVEACRCGNVPIVEIMLPHAQVNLADKVEEHSPLTVACAQSHVLVVEALIQAGADVNYLQKGVGSALTDACGGKMKTQAKIVALLLGAGADPKQQFRSMYGDIVSDVLTSACSYGSIAAIDLLLEHGASVNVCYVVGTPIITAVKERRPDLVEFLLDRGADPTITVPNESRFTDVVGRSAVDLARAGKSAKARKILQLFVQRGFVPKTP